MANDKITMLKLKRMLQLLDAGKSMNEICRDLHMSKRNCVKNQTLAYLGLQLCFAYAPITYTSSNYQRRFLLAYKCSSSTLLIASGLSKSRMSVFLLYLIGLFICGCTLSFGQEIKR